jgi:hypothetical protein
MASRSYNDMIVQFVEGHCRHLKLLSSEYPTKSFPSQYPRFSCWAEPAATARVSGRYILDSGGWALSRPTGLRLALGVVGAAVPMEIRLAAERKNGPRMADVNRSGPQLEVIQW